MKTKQKLFSLILISAFIILFASVSFAQDMQNSVVKVMVASNHMNYTQPWQSYGMTGQGGSGCVIAGNKILTNAHVVADHTFIQVKKNTDPKKYTAKVEAIGNDCDLALLTIDDPKFFDDTVPFELGGLPELQETVTVLGYPEGGGKLSITKGVVSRVEVTTYAQSGRQLLTVQIDAAINPGNSGGPVTQDNKLVGIAMQVLHSGQNIGFIIPTEVIHHFLDDLKDGSYDGFPIMGIDYDTTENPTMREFYKIADNDGGVLLTRVLPYSPSENILKRGDVMLSIDGMPIAEDGTYRFRGEERLGLPHLITRKHINDEIKVKIIRDGLKKDVVCLLKAFKPMIPYPYFYDKPPYFIYGGVVFSVLTADLIQSWGSRWWETAPLDFTYYQIGSGRLNKERRKEMVIILGVLSDDINVGYQSIDKGIVEKVNGQEVGSFKDFILSIDKIKNNEKYTIIDMHDNGQIVLRNENIDAVDEAIMARNSIPKRYSDDVAGWLGLTPSQEEKGEMP